MAFRLTKAAASTPSPPQDGSTGIRIHGLQCSQRNAIFSGNRQQGVARLHRMRRADINAGTARPALNCAALNTRNSRMTASHQQTASDSRQASRSVPELLLDANWGWLGNRPAIAPVPDRVPCFPAPTVRGRLGGRGDGRNRGGGFGQGELAVVDMCPGPPRPCPSSAPA